MVTTIKHLLIVCISYYLRLCISSMHPMLSSMTIFCSWIIRWGLLLYLIKFIFLSSRGANRMDASVRTLGCDSFSQRLLIVVEFQAFIKFGSFSLVHIVGISIWIHFLNVFSFMTECLSLSLEISHSLLIPISSTKWLKDIISFIRIFKRKVNGTRTLIVKNARIIHVRFIELGRENLVGADRHPTIFYLTQVKVRNSLFSPSVTSLYRHRTTTHPRVVSVGAKVVLATLTETFGLLHVIHRLNLPFHNSILIVHISLQFL